MPSSGTLEDRVDINELHARYCLTIDNGRYEEWIACFTSDGVFESPRFGSHAGPAGLKKFAALYKESLGGAKILHVVTNVLYALDGNSGSGTAYLLYYHCKDGRIQQTTVGHYTDKLEKTAGGWRFKSRQVTILGHS